MILSKLGLIQNIQTELSDNSTGSISPYDIRHNLLDIIDSVHLLTGDQNLNAINFATPATRTTKAGEATIEKINLDGYSSIDNSAFGYGALRSNYTGSRNTAIGSEAIGCNIYGEDNVAVGYSALGGNTTGLSNVGIGNYSLNRNKIGNFNVAIGHGAGYYVDRDTSYKLFIASHDIVDGEYVCDNPLGSGLIPLIHGDFQLLKLGIATSGLHNFGTLQVSGAITPAQDDLHNLGHSSYQFRQLYLSSGIQFPSNRFIKNSTSGITIAGSFLPDVNDTYNLGAPGLRWANLYVDDLFVSGNATITSLTSITSFLYSSKTIYLAASGGPYGYLNDSSLEGAGFIIKSSGVDYQRDYKLTFVPPTDGSCLQSNTAYDKASWNSNISFHVDSGNHIKTNRILSYDNLVLRTPETCYGLMIHNSGNRAFFSRQENLLSDVTSSSGHLAGIGNINFLANSGNLLDYVVTIGALESGVNVVNRFVTGTKNRVRHAGNNYKDRLNGFDIKYIDDYRNAIPGDLTDRLVIGSYYQTSEMINALTIMKGENDAVVGINNFGSYSDYILPKTTFNVRSTGDAIGRFASEHPNKQSAIQLVGGNNCLMDGAELAYHTSGAFADLNLYQDSGRMSFLKLNSNNKLGIFNGSGTANSLVTIGDYITTEAVIGMWVASGNPTNTANYGKLFVRPKIANNQWHSLYFMDGSGNAFDLILNKFDTTNGSLIYGDANGNTFGGIECPDNRNDIPSANNNTAYGYRALKSVTTGDYNISIGSVAATGITTGSYNTIVGYNSADGITTQSSNIVIGANSYISSAGSNNLIIGNNLSGIAGDYNFFIGGENLVLLQGKLGPSNSDKFLLMPSGGSLRINTTSNTEGILIKPKEIQVLDTGGTDYPVNSLAFKFIGNQTQDLFILNHTANPISNTPSYQAPATARPYAQINGDLKLRGAIRFSDSTSVESATFLQDIDILASGLNNTNSAVSDLSLFTQNLVVEGYVIVEIPAPSNGSSPTTGTLHTKNASWVDVSEVTIVNRDTTSTIHAGAYVVAMRVNNEYRPIWISAKDATCACCNN